MSGLKHFTLQFSLLGILILLLSASASQASRGENLARSCAPCHGTGGISSNELWPNLRSQNEVYLFNQLQNFRSGERRHELMTPIANSFSDDDLHAIAKYFSEL